MLCNVAITTLSHIPHRHGRPRTQATQKHASTNKLGCTTETPAACGFDSASGIIPDDSKNIMRTRPQKKERTQWTQAEPYSHHAGSRTHTQTHTHAQFSHMEELVTVKCGLVPVLQSCFYLPFSIGIFLPVQDT